MKVGGGLSGVNGWLVVTNAMGVVWGKQWGLVEAVWRTVNSGVFMRVSGWEALWELLKA